MQFMHFIYNYSIELNQNSSIINQLLTIVFQRRIFLLIISKERKKEKKKKRKRKKFKF